ncbi:MAG: hypothetical protein ACREIK_07920 [Nitrospiraceae bacterium]
MTLMLSGCQGLHLQDHQVGQQESVFSHLWGVYTHCRAGSDLETMRQDAHRLSQAPPVDQSPPALLPDSLRRLVSRPPLRLSVDPRAMAASCALHAGQTALTAGQSDLAGDMFHQIIRKYPEAEYAYYVDQARKGLGQAVSNSGPFPLLHLVSTP